MIEKACRKKRGLFGLSAIADTGMQPVPTEGQVNIIKAAGSLLLVVGLVVDDAFGVGAADDWLIPVVIGGFIVGNSTEVLPIV